MNNKVKIYHVDYGTTFGYDITDDEKKIWYFIQMDLFGDGNKLVI